jgi:hypothetical protein
VSEGGIAVVRCPQCGGTPDPGGGPGFLARCSSCRVLGRIVTPGGDAPALACLPAVTRGVLPEILDAEAATRGAPAPRLTRGELLFVPFWRATAVIAGRLRGRREHFETVIRRGIDENGTVSYMQEVVRSGEEQVDREVQQVKTVLVSACPLEELGLPTLDRERQMPGRLGLSRAGVQGAQVVVFHPELRREGTTLDPLVRRPQAQAEVDAVLARACAGLGGGMLEATVTAEVLSCTIGLFYYPVYACEVLAPEGAGSACIDGVNGDVIALRLPDEGPRVRRMERQFMVVAGLLLGFLSAGLARAAVFLPPALRGPDDAPLRARLLAAGLFLGAGALVGLVRLARRLDAS